MRKQVFALVAASLLMASVVGCEQKVEVAGHRGGVAVIDLNKVFSAMEWDKDINSSLQTDKNAMDQVLSQARAALLAQLDTVRKNIAEKGGLSEEQTKALTAIKTAADLEKLPLPKELRDEYARSLVLAEQAWQAQAQQHQQVFNNRRMAMLNNYRNVLKPVADQLAQQKGYALVLVPSDTMVYFSQTADISNDIVVELKRIKPEIPPLPPATQPSLNAAKP